MSDEQEEPTFVRHAKLFELLRQENIATQHTIPAAHPVEERQMSEQELLSRALGSLNPRG
ncbi:MAG: hypothetical protein AAFN80_07070 [Pseudomonadota bacterium]